MSCQTTRNAFITRDGDALSAWVIITWTGPDQQPLTSSAIISADATRPGWDALRTELREWYSPITLECGQ
ncbi:hypothetical protein L1285_20900 [Pseudoalteromonas sp. DL2-H2.2]|uniref:hypothetical protein n=1 Tax=Pseudoalteromonas sp. DL2-H2.2 TaxID=2908889 RepID=UPI001F261C48|nr:hypothetical protein [Pseudoalteromonas sp. DL2-H2.2]MCF2910770.1 hypothetical protein [Pseudoalteromonas sp. DL2-H2.2]